MLSPKGEGIISEASPELRYTVFIYFFSPFFSGELSVSFSLF